MTLAHHHVRIDDTSIHYVEDGQASEAPTLIFFHGFPEFWQTWHQQLDYFSPTHRVIAPDLPGYNLSDKPTEVEFYHPQNLIKLMAKFIAKVAPNQRVCLVAHDWGGAIAWPLAAFNPQLVARLVILNAAHPSTFTREMITNASQRNKSAYIQQLIADDAAQVLAENNYQFLRSLVFDDLNEQQITQQQKDAYITAWSQPGAIAGMLAYYRAMPQLAPPDNQEHQQSTTATSEMKIPHIMVNQPCLVLWGEQDKAFANEVLNGLAHYVPMLELVRYPEATHWLQHQQSASVNQHITQFIQA